MPELPEVETIRRQLEPRLVGLAITEAGSHWSDKFTPATEATGATIDSVGRRGKFLLVALAGQTGLTGADREGGERELIIHLGMTGKVSVEPEPDLDRPYLRAWWALDDDTTLCFDDVRRFGRIRVVPAGDYSSIPTLAVAGPEPFDPTLTPEVFRSRIGASRRRIKTQLLSQRPIAGVGNIYADEALWMAQISPRATRLGPERAERLLEALRAVLAQGIDNGGTTLRDYRDAGGGTGSNQFELAAYGRAGEPCLRCATELRSAVIDARTTTWCPRCQQR